MGSALGSFSCGSDVIESDRNASPENLLHDLDGRLTSKKSNKASEQISWKTGQKLGEGSYGQVFLAINTRTGQLMAVKQIVLPKIAEQDRTNYLKNLRKIKNEINLLRSVKNENVVKYLGTHMTHPTLNFAGKLSVFLEFVPGGSIASLIYHFGPFEESLVRAYTKQILHGLRYLHKKGIVHRDIKGGNILVDQTGVCKLADFGASMSIKDLLLQESPSVQGTVSWMAPEVLKQEPHDTKVDVWSLGCTVVEMLSGRPPWPVFDNMMAMIFHIVNSSIEPILPELLSQDGRDFVLRCLNRDPAARPTISELLAHPFVAKAFTTEGVNHSIHSGSHQGCAACAAAKASASAAKAAAAAALRSSHQEEGLIPQQFSADQLSQPTKASDVISVCNEQASFNPLALVDADEHETHSITIANASATTATTATT
eukprot:CAMPEP_0175177460 /NCGR_PEP_ID=MMETSP0087-20121206/34404_1 /TAXON_ID=136419 /ORGANISM="Unknown Unknown, Strain D1" /LENGTH=427 /DNA_ID=CAMNT_0016469451 /DNA_START=12 /DNA_END=1291 /DNA_ORIENTATION=+